MTSPAHAPRPTPRRLTASEAQSRPVLRLAPEPFRRRRTRVWVGVVVAMVFGSLLASAIFYSGLVSGQVHLDRVDHRIDVERTTLRREQARLADLQSPARIAKAAAQRGMVPADPVYWVSPRSGVAPVATGPEAATTNSTTTIPTTPSASTSSTPARTSSHTDVAASR